ncbi:MAG: Omp28-related outer membrane protein [Muribaculaceae bacterium]|nr:Omp28-related outer membrane protein [Muribaculaceae bacterium]
MNKTLLFLSALVLCGSGIRAAAPELVSSDAQARPAMVQAKADEAPGKIEFRYYEDNETTGLAFTNLSNGEVWEAVQMPKDVAATYAGSKITSLNIITPTNKLASNVNYVRSITVYISTSRGGTPVYTQSANLGTVTNTLVNVALDTPYEITGDNDVWFGYYFTLNRNIANNNYYIATDGVPSASSAGAWIKANNEWTTCNEYGNLLIGAVVEGDNLPGDMATIAGLELDGYAENGSDLTFGVNVRNTGANELNSVELEYSFLGQTKTVQHTFTTPLAYYETAVVELSIPCNVVSSAGNILKVTALKANGVDNNSTKNVAETNVICYPAGAAVKYRQNVLMEESTGTWCPNCPLGIVSIETLKEKYTDGSFIPVAVHYDDDMQTTSYNQYFSLAGSSFPYYMLNRKAKGGFAQNNEYNVSRIEAAYNELTAMPAKAGIKLDLDWTSDKRTSIHATATSEFAFDITGTYRVAFIVVEDGVGPYDQLNNLTGTPGFGIFSTGGTKISWTFDDVARYIYGVFGMTDSSIVNPTGETPYTYDIDLSLSSVTDINNARIVAALLDANTREVVNAVEVALPGTSGVDNVVDEESAVSISTVMGGLTVSGADVTEVYTIDGRRAATAYGEASISLPAGLYVVKADNVVRKVIVK